MASTYLSRVNGTATSAYKWTWSGWVKRAKLGTRQMFFIAVNPASAANYAYIEFDGANDNLQYIEYDETTSINGITNAKYRDTSGWYHIVVATDTTQVTGSDRIKLYVNGEQVTSFSTHTYGTQNQTTRANLSGKTQQVGAYGTVSNFYFDGSMADVYFIDGLAYDASTFGSFDSTTGIWKPNTAPTVTYGANGFNLKFTNGADAGEDFSGNNNDLATNGTPTQTLDCPSNVFATMNPIIPSSSVTFSNGNNTLTGSNSANYDQNNAGTLGVSAGKYYWEVKYATANANTNSSVGIAKLEGYRSDVNNTATSGYAVVRFDGQVYVDNVAGSPTYWGSNPVAGDIIMFALDMDNGKFYLGKNGTWENSGDPTSGSTGTGSITTSLSGTYTCTMRYLASVFQTNYGNGFFGTTAVVSAGTNAGVGTFEYDVPAGYYALCTKNINTQEYS